MVRQGLVVADLGLRDGIDEGVDELQEGSDVPGY